MENLKSLVITGTGRCGTHMMAAVLKKNNTVDSYHSDDLNIYVEDTFYRYCHFNNLDIDHTPIFDFRKQKIITSNSYGKVYCESNPYLSCAIKDINELLNSKIAILIRSPKDTVNSFFIKGFYNNKLNRSDPTLPLGIIPGIPLHRFFARIIPIGNEYEKWKSYTRIGKISWWWKVCTEDMISQIQYIPPTDRIILKVERFDYSHYLNLCEFANIKNTINEKQFSKIIKSRRGKGKAKKSSDEWSFQEQKEFEEITTATNKKMNSLINY